MVPAHGGSGGTEDLRKAEWVWLGNCGCWPLPLAGPGTFGGPVGARGDAESVGLPQVPRDIKAQKTRGCWGCKWLDNRSCSLVFLKCECVQFCGQAPSPNQQAGLVSRPAGTGSLEAEGLADGAEECMCTMCARGERDRSTGVRQHKLGGPAHGPDSGMHKELQRHGGGSFTGARTSGVWRQGGPKLYNHGLQREVFAPGARGHHVGMVESFTGSRTTGLWRK